MAALSRDIEVLDRTILTKLEYIEKGMDSLDKKINQLDARQWQIIFLLLSYPIGLLIGKVCHIF